MPWSSFYFGRALHAAFSEDELRSNVPQTSCCSLPGLKEMRPLKRKRIEAPRVAFLEDVHPHTKWSMCVRLYHKFHVDGFAPGRKRLYMILLDKGRKKMGAVMYDNDVDRLGPLLVEGRAYYISRMSARPLHRNMEYMFGDNREILCHLTNETAISEVKQVNEKFTPDFPEFMPFSRFWKNVFDDYKRVDVIAMPMRVSPVMYHRSACGRRIPTKNVQLMDDSYNMITLVVKDMLLTSNLFNWWKCAEDRKIIVVTMLQLKSDGPCELHTTDYSRVYFNPNTAAAEELKKKINNELSGPSFPSTKDIKE